LSNETIQSIANTITIQISESFGGSYEDVDVVVFSNFTVAENSTDISGSDHLFMIVDPSHSNLQNSDKTISYGAANIGGVVAMINSDIINNITQLARTGAHEFGHMAGLEHPEEQENPNILNDSDNLMHQSGVSSGTNIVQDQIEIIESTYTNEEE